MTANVHGVPAELFWHVNKMSKSFDFLWIWRGLKKKKSRVVFFCVVDSLSISRSIFTYDTFERCRVLVLCKLCEHEKQKREGRGRAMSHQRDQNNFKQK